MSLRFKFVLPINLIIVAVLGASLAWEWRRSRDEELGERRMRLDEEVRFIGAAYREFGPSPRFGAFLEEFCRAADPVASPGQQVAVLEGGTVVAAAAGPRVRQRLDPTRLASLEPGFWTRSGKGGPFLVRVTDDGGRQVIMAESIRPVHGLVMVNIWDRLGWGLGLGALLLVSVNTVMSRTVLRPIGRLAGAVRQLERGQHGVQVDMVNGDELGTLGRRFNAMSMVIAEYVEANQRELETARRVQSHLLPPHRFRIGCLEVAGRCLPMGPVGGDVFDVQPLMGDRIGIFVADLSGHNVAAALHTAMVRAIAWREAEGARTPGEVLARLNDRLCRDLPEEQFATAFFGWFEGGSGRFRYANAGHPAAFLVSRDGSMSELSTTAPLLGILPEFPEESATVELEPGARLLVYTDGITEASDPHGALWGTDELVELIRAAGPATDSELVGGILERLAAFRGGQSQQDDVTIVLARYEPGSASPVTRAESSCIGADGDQTSGEVHGNRNGCRGGEFV